ncbi:MAG: hypothetical protein ACXWF8_04415 [Methylobacter sp.]
MNKRAMILIVAAQSILLLNISFLTIAKSEVITPLAQTSAAQPKLLFDGDTAEWRQFEPYQAAGDLTFQQNRIAFNTLAETNDEWDYIYLDPDKYPWKNITWEFTAVRRTAFREFAFNFRNRDFDNRYRYRFDDDKLFFDKKVNGNWSSNIASVPFPMALGKPYRIRIDTVGALNRCWVDGHLMLENVDHDIASGSIAIILWEDDGKTDIDAEVYDNRVMELI